MVLCLSVCVSLLSVWCCVCQSVFHCLAYGVVFVSLCFTAQCMVLCFCFTAQRRVLCLSVYVFI